MVDAIFPGKNNHTLNSAPDLAALKKIISVNKRSVLIFVGAEKSVEEGIRHLSFSL